MAASGPAAAPAFAAEQATEAVSASARLAAGEAAELAIAALGQRAAAAGAAQAHGPVRALETSCRYLGDPPGDLLKAEARPLGEGAACVWRASVHRGFGAFRAGPATLAAEVTTTFAPAPAKSAPLAAEPAAAEAAPAGATADLRRQQILRAACEAIARKGYDKTSVREIAAAAGLPIATLYLYVRNKEDILQLITQGLMEDIFRDFRENLSAEGKASDKLARAIASYLGYVDRNRKYINLVYRETRSLSRENREKIFAIERDFARLWQEILEEGVAAGEFEMAEPALTAELVYFLCNAWSIRHWTVGRFEPALVREELSRFALQGITKRGDRGND